MRRALTSIVLVVAWMVPATGWSCPSDARGAAAHAHVDSDEAAPHSHSHADHGHGSHDAAAGGHSGQAQGTSSDDPSCCERGPETPAVQAVLKDAQPRPKFSTAVLPAFLAVTARPDASATGAQLRRQQPPLLPYARTRRPLLI
ncbi:MAG: hypothetical protein V3U03_16935 [Myxococcota bacterium]